MTKPRPAVHPGGDSRRLGESLSRESPRHAESMAGAD
jgi:hypothetical protein